MLLPMAFELDPNRHIPTHAEAQDARSKELRRLLASRAHPDDLSAPIDPLQFQPPQEFTIQNVLRNTYGVASPVEPIEPVVNPHVLFRQQYDTGTLGLSPQELDDQTLFLQAVDQLPLHPPPVSINPTNEINPPVYLEPSNLDPIGLLRWRKMHENDPR
jgi:hypothetical protein